MEFNIEPVRYTLYPLAPIMNPLSFLSILQIMKCSAVSTKDSQTVFMSQVEVQDEK
jgi:hypothetical protein